ncbi:putative transposase OrfB [Anaerohalosphaera lusitana]|uniref:Putative transposase OrfB n=1 Tax=Anaerohalosphaera lusitana TaxID=1936003 RepID=A0A1U9NLZ0_9BACT|nr:putative transposase OrfB [Anaerohalosphaera lusitana]AQT68561.1 putative transposase OrfB [Anaerohalosphaera lusitana]AQT68845.1 putative transposase OrfB [Anaerohalosphaera lusitana]
MIGQPRASQRYKSQQQPTNTALTSKIIELAKEHQSYGYRFITAKLRQHGWRVNHKRVQRIWRKEALQVPHRRKGRKTKGNSDNSCSVQKADYKDHVWTYDFVSDQSEDGRSLKFLTVLDEFTRESLTIEVGRSIKSGDVVETLEYLFAVRGVPGFIRSDNGPEFVASAIKKKLGKKNVETLYIEKGQPWENGFIESFNGKFRDEVLNRELFYSVKEAKVIVEQWRMEYNNHRPHSGLDYATPAEFAASCIASASPTAQLQQYTTDEKDNSLTVAGT